MRPSECRPAERNGNQLPQGGWALSWQPPVAAEGRLSGTGRAGINQKRPAAKKSGRACPADTEAPLAPRETRRGSEVLERSARDKRVDPSRCDVMALA